MKVHWKCQSIKVIFQSIHKSTCYVLNGRTILFRRFYWLSIMVSTVTIERYETN